MPGNATYFNDIRGGTKYKSHKIETLEGIFDSQLEWNRWCWLRKYQDEGIIENLRRQVKYELIPAQKINGRVVERAVTYTADFQYLKDGKLVVEDTKSEPTRTKDYIIKRKLMLWIHNIKLKEIDKRIVTDL